MGINFYLMKEKYVIPSAMSLLNGVWSSQISVTRTQNASQGQLIFCDDTFNTIKKNPISLLESANANSSVKTWLRVQPTSNDDNDNWIIK